jgi:hypothetical protein
VTRGAAQASASTSGASTAAVDLDATLDVILREGHPLIRKEHVIVVHHDPFLLALRTTPGFIEQAFLRVSTFAFVLSAIVAAIVGVGAAPWPIGILVGVWLSMATFARVFVHRRRRELGDHLVDFERAIFAHLGPGRSRVVALDEIVLATADDPLDDKARWVTVRIRARGDARPKRGAQQLFRIAYGTPIELERLLFLFRRYGIRETEGHATAPV